MAEQRTTRSRKEGDLYDAAEEFIGGVGRLGYGLLALPLSLFPRQTRTHYGGPLVKHTRSTSYPCIRCGLNVTNT